MLHSIPEIEKNYPNWYLPDSELSKDDQQWIWENLPLHQEDKQQNYIVTESNVIVNRSVNGGGKLTGNFNKTPIKILAIESLKHCNYKTPSKKIADILNSIFGIWEEKPNHWLYVAQTYTPKTINSVIYQIFKASDRGDITFVNAGAYFTSIIKHKHKRKTFRRKDNRSRELRNPKLSIGSVALFGTEKEGKDL